MEYEPVIGLEVHAQIHTKSKMFCSCPVVEDTGDLAPNTYVCPVCTAMPGALPVINRRAVEIAIMAGLALHCQVPPATRFARKSYFYPDLPKGYQISQYTPVFPPLTVNGYLEIETEAGVKRVGVNRAHLEEDAGKLYHRGSASLVDLNRAGVPLLEIVSEPDMRSAEEALAYATKLHAYLVYLGVNAGDMEKGMMRFEANISVRPIGSDVMNPRHEIKNLNSFRALARSVDYEIEYQIATLEAGGAITQQTMGWDDARGVTVPQRGKEFADDYRYFPEPDLPILEIDQEWVEGLRSQLPELPDAKRARFTANYGLSDYDARVLVADKRVADYFEAAVAASKIAPKTIANWVTGELFRLMKENGQEIGAVKISPSALAELIGLVKDDTINLSTGKEVLEEMFASGNSARQIVEKRGLAQISDTASLEQIIAQVLDENPEQVGKYLDGKVQIAGWLMGQVMRATQGKANPQVVQELLRAQLEIQRGK
ncbi:MAG: Asp-tRNA(Asn)/Glu-tRNA(Gln) amidotransferase GatCAB subunit B [Chloroflexi bacterium]|nr:MAG: glutaminyl-tRNA synthase (glutamine-hydrolyzing) subunit B [Anaerolineaceae bacterium 4572_32.2]RLC86553.1 MAG: Asp-tRNA(Asn)/Glu-tRNA(Gln) amidotransferase GatCAB subunit B [Chloroflexota bacterium]HEY72585.1 Asp-tRNA(Asn)/Glu-tRNA(Gln) amidotransferase subunit GatB [Thermoflexia bacterium]